MGGFRAGAYAKVWQIEKKSDKIVNIRISISEKDKRTNEYKQTFSGWVSILGLEAATKAVNQIHDGDRIRLGIVDVYNSYDKVTKATTTQYKCFSFDTEEEANESIAQPVTKAEQGFSDILDDFDDMPF